KMDELERNFEEIEIPLIDELIALSDFADAILEDDDFSPQPKEQNFSCKLCNKSYSHRSSLWNHCKIPQDH
ncbi:hypothetical protein AVEN_103336-2-1, partial [Araneus ventricosus]